MARLVSTTQVALGAGVTAVGVPVGTALSGGELSAAGALPLTGALVLITLVGRRWPVRALALAVTVVIGYRTAGLVDTGWVWQSSLLFGWAVLAGRAGRAYLIGGGALWFAAVWEWAVVGHGPQWVAGHLGGEALWLAAVLAAATAYRNRLRWQDEVTARLRQSRHEAELDAARRRAEERLRIARELHDVVAHTLAVVGVHLHVAMDTLDAAPAETRAALQLAQQVRGAAMADLKALVGVLRDGSDSDVQAPAAQLDDLAELIRQVRVTGLSVTLAERGDPRSVPAPVALAAYRVVQEALTNSVRHAAATRADVALCYEPGRVTIAVTDDGAGGEPTGGGHGITGMRERVTALRGVLTAGPAAGGGFSVQATIPTEEPT